MAKIALLLKNASTPLDPYEQRFRKEGYEPIFIPLLTHTHTDRDATIEYILSEKFLKHTDIFIITSQRGVEMFGECLALCSEDIRHQIYQKTGYTVGPATHQVLSRLGFQDVRGGESAGNGTKLAELIHQELQGGPQKIVFFTGEIRKDIIPRILREKKYNFEERVIYKTENRLDIVENFNNAWERIKEGDHWIVFFSPQGTETIVQHIKREGIAFNIASIGPTTEEYLVQNQIIPTIVSPKPQADSLVDFILAQDGKR
ncbi:Uroporphyrinogen-III synthetase [Suhomyces tanzawaensis NRRL Y-17324]|uniref:Uroporphyrinogen-III synthetase n=1 Tax=Suhomyces tanzawaensis NRRL Y-17324 TaxID=984487 RepID=A0A1E4SSG0_9ASCO|nr:Uroporphyrinogen-III synthetase [Suhomyces tanzawaensis NRRL Y-17324]ODV82444.1 Uroporphyrinogen-III synthetase [Suhomyces tanzawaensis NRRL Y-17324]